MIDGIGPDAPVIVTSGGGKHAASPYAFELVPPVALFEVARTLADGAKKYGIDNWRGVPIADQLGHALQHVYGYLAGDISDDHLAHAACRILFALELSRGLGVTASTARAHNPGSAGSGAERPTREGSTPSPSINSDDFCEHLSWTGDEGPISKLGRWPTRWKCDGCGVIRHDSDLGPRGSNGSPETAGTSGTGSSPVAGPFHSDEWRKDLDYLAPERLN